MVNTRRIDFSGNESDCPESETFSALGEGILDPPLADRTDGLYGSGFTGGQTLSVAFWLQSAAVCLVDSQVFAWVFCR